MLVKNTISVQLTSGRITDHSSYREVVQISDDTRSFSECFMIEIEANQDPHQGRASILIWNHDLKRWHTLHTLIPNTMRSNKIALNLKQSLTREHFAPDRDTLVDTALLIMGARR